MTARRDRTPIQQRLLSLRQAADYCGLSLNTFLAHIPVPVIKVGRRHLVDRIALDRWIDESQGLAQPHAPNPWDDVAA